MTLILLGVETALPHSSRVGVTLTLQVGVPASCHRGIRYADRTVWNY